MNKESAKDYLLISFVVVELLSMLFNYYFVQIRIGQFEYHLNFSIVFFCLGFFIVDIVADQFSAAIAKKYIFYKLYCQILFLILGQLAITVYGLDHNELAEAFHKSGWMIASSLLATYAGFHVMSFIMNYMKIKTYQGASTFKRYLYSTIPGELLFSFIFTLLCFYTYASFDELMHVFITSAIAKLILSIVFAAIMEVAVTLRFIEQKYPQKSP